MAQELTHKTIQDGWFREISDTMWPGQAMALRVKKILHVEQSKYQDVCSFVVSDIQLKVLIVFSLGSCI